MSQSPKVLSHTDVRRLLEATDRGETWSYIDVRTPIEFSSGHIEGAYNVPFKHGSVEGLSDNADFAATITHSFVRSHRLIIGCHTGGRAKAACAQLAALGYTTLGLHAESLAGSRDHFGRLQPGWLAQGLPVVTTPVEGRTYAELLSSTHRARSKWSGA